MTKPNPTQVAYDRIQRAGARSPMNLNGGHIWSELYQDGIRVRCLRTDGLERETLVSWRRIAMAKGDPLLRAHLDLIDYLNARGASNADS